MVLYGDEMTYAIVGELSNGVSNVWKIGNHIPDCAEIKLGDYVVVQNRNGYDLVRIIAFVEGKEDDIRKHLSNGNKLKEVIRVVGEINE